MPDTIFMMKTLIAFAKENGATDVDIKLAQDDVFSFGCRMGNPETIERSQSNAITIRLFKGKKKQSINASTLDEQTLKNAILTDRIAHGYIFTGPRGVGKTSSARIFAKALTNWKNARWRKQLSISNVR